MKIVKHELSNGNTITYKVIDGTYYHESTPIAVTQLLEQSRNTRERFVFHYGDVKTGRAWGDSETGYIGRSTGEHKIPLLIKNSRSAGGGAILDHCIVKIEVANKKFGGILYNITK